MIFHVQDPFTFTAKSSNKEMTKREACLMGMGRTTLRTSGRNVGHKLANVLVLIMPICMTLGPSQTSREE